MGPECGTAMLGGVGLGFANAVREGPVGIVAAAGTGAQEASVLLDRAGTGVSQIVGVGGRDLSADVGGIMFRQGMELLAADDGTDTLLLVSKPPDPDAVRALGDVDVGGKRVVAAFVGWDGGDAPFEVHATLEAGAAAAAGGMPLGGIPLGGMSRGDIPPAGEGGLLGLFSGGSLAHEAQTILGPAIASSTSARRSTPRAARTRWSTSSCGGGCCASRGRRPAASCSTSCSATARTPIRRASWPETLEALARGRPVIAHVCGTNEDPQDAARQEATLREAGVHVAPTNAAAARMARSVVA